MGFQPKTSNKCKQKAKVYPNNQQKKIKDNFCVNSQENSQLRCKLIDLIDIFCKLTPNSSTNDFIHNMTITPLRICWQLYN